jgi:hypothetical protein
MLTKSGSHDNKNPRKINKDSKQCLQADINKDTAVSYIDEICFSV